RRRHTRVSRDWSSDVCSSALAWLQNARHLGDRIVDVDYVLEDEARGHAVEGAVPERQAGGTGAGEGRSPTTLVSHEHLRPGRIEDRKSVVLGRRIALGCAHGG